MADEYGYFKGLKELQEFLDQLPVQMETKIMRGAMRAGMSVVKPLAQALIHPVSGQLAKGLTLSTRVNRDGSVSASLKAKGPHGYVAKWLEYGTRSHAIVGFVAFRGEVRRGVMHPGARPKPFMRPALDASANAAIIASAQYIQQRLTKEGLSRAADVQIGEREG